MKEAILATVLICVGLTGCGGGSGSRGNDGEVGAAGGTVTASDGKAVLTIPAGALSADTAITITPQSDGSYNLEPSGLVFNTPAIATLTLPNDAPTEITLEDGSFLPLPNAVAGRMFSLTSADGTEEMLDGVTIARKAGEDTVTVTVPVPHFSLLKKDDNLGSYLSVGMESSQYNVNDEFQPTVKVVANTKVYKYPLEIRKLVYSGQGQVALKGVGEEPINTLVIADTEVVVSRDPVFTCQGPGQGEVGVEAHFDAGLYDLDFTLKVTVPVTCTGDGTGAALTNGVYSLPTGSKPEGLSILSPQLVAAISPFAAWKIVQLVAGDQRVTAYGYNSPPVEIDTTDSGFLYGWSSPTYGVLAFSTGDGSTAEFFAYGPTGWARQSYGFPAPDNEFGATWLENGSTYDATTIGGGTTNVPGFVAARGTKFDIWELDTTLKYLVRSVINLPGVTAVSAYQHQAGGPIVGVDGMSPGALFVVNPADATPSPAPIGNLGNDPRRVRCLPPLCVVSNYGSDSLTVITWDGVSLTPTIEGTVAVGDGPVGIDLVQTGSNIAVVSTGFNDNSYSVTVLAADGGIVSNTKTATPDGCTNPGHATFAEEAGATKIIMTCNGSDNFVIMDSGM